MTTYDPSKKTDDEAEQEIVRAAIILRIIQPYSSGMHLVLTAEGEPGNIFFSGVSRVGIGSNTYVCASDVDAWLTREHIRKAKVMWPNIQTVCQQWKQHRRILRALRRQPSRFPFALALRIPVRIRHSKCYYPCAPLSGHLA
jgi:hypothetical protein